MRRIIYRGKALLEVEGVCKEGDWVYGTLVDGMGKVYIVGEVVEADDEEVKFEWWVEVDRASVGQATGYKTYGGREVYEGDILGRMYGDGKTIKEVVGSVSWGRGKFVMKMGGVDMYLTVVLENKTDLEILGNIHDNADTLKRFGLGER